MKTLSSTFLPLLQTAYLYYHHEKQKSTVFSKIFYFFSTFFQLTKNKYLNNSFITKKNTNFIIRVLFLLIIYIIIYYIFKVDSKANIIISFNDFNLCSDVKLSFFTFESTTVNKHAAFLFKTLAV